MPTAEEKRAALLKERSELQLRADKQIDTAHKNIDKLREVGYPRFYIQLSRFGDHAGWAKAIFDFTVPALTVEDIQDDDDAARDTIESHKNYLDRRAANFIILTATDGSIVADLIENLPPGNPRLLLNTIHGYFHPDSIGGTKVAYRNFFNAKQENTNTTIVAWIAHVSRTAKIVRSSHGLADKKAELTVLLDGLLPEFATINTILQQNAALTLRGAVNQLLDYARSNDLLELCRGGRKNPGKGNVFIAVVKEQRGRYSTRPPMTSDEKAKWIAGLGT